MNPLALLALAVDTAGSAIVLAAVIGAMVSYARSLGRTEWIAEQQRLLASGLVLALTFKSGAGILRTATVQTWSQLGMVVVIIGIRFALGRVVGRAGS